ncbi:hypothetical protein [Streptomyces sp. Ncost-T10-10d]|uniref:hypothetical protein n=1 Tax=Streptomyces sp. Ncost-T10-10d TaxID=1839774 RepID=UPI00081E4537|nr:hypothetical protein [Streptomyces sp. Ncost-T10-10d]SCF61874.1 hypothetical protein GA0115254_108038 [Streptomyces sp. Ncost-T10-10d]
MAVAGAFDGTLHVWGMPDMLNTDPDPKAFLFPWELREISVSRLPDTVSAVATVEAGGRTPVLAAGRALYLVDPDTGNAVGPPASGQTDIGTITSVAMGLVRGRPAAVTGSVDGAVRVWWTDAWLLAGDSWPEQVLAWRFPAAVNAVALAPDDHIAVGFGADVAVLVVDPQIRQAR